MKFYQEISTKLQIRHFLNQKVLSFHISYFIISPQEHNAFWRILSGSSLPRPVCSNTLGYYINMMVYQANLSNLIVSIQDPWPIADQCTYRWSTNDIWQAQISYWWYYSKCPKISYTKVSNKMAYANSADQDQTAPEGAVWSGSTLFAI